MPLLSLTSFDDYFMFDLALNSSDADLLASKKGVSYERASSGKKISTIVRNFSQEQGGFYDYPAKNPEIVNIKDAPSLSALTTSMTVIDPHQDWIQVRFTLTQSTVGMRKQGSATE